MFKNVSRCKEHLCSGDSDVQVSRCFHIWMYNLHSSLISVFLRNLVKRGNNRFLSCVRQKTLDQLICEKVRGYWRKLDLCPACTFGQGVKMSSKQSTQTTIILKNLYQNCNHFFFFFFLLFPPETFGCNFIQRFKSFQFIGYNIETFISCFKTQTMWFSLPSTPESSIVHR